MANLRIDIASEFTGKPAFTKAEAATNSLDKAVDKLGKRLAGAFSAYKVAEFAKASVKAFAEDQKAAAVLAKTLDNVNQGYATDMVNNYIAKTEALYGVLDDKLRPAFSQLVVATGDATKSQALLQTALDLSAATGKDLESVTSALSKAYLGNTTALSRLGAGLSAADLKGKNFNDIIKILNQNFSGAAATAADTYGGKIDRLNVAFANMQETIGKGIIDAFGQLNNDAGFNGVIDKMGALAGYIADVTVGLGVIAGKIQSALKPLGGINSNVLKTLIFGPAAGITDALASIGSRAKTKNAQASGVTLFLQDMNKIAAATAKANGNAKQLLNTSKALTKEAKDKLALDKASAVLNKAKSVFDLDAIQLAAAAKTATGEDAARIKLKQDILALEDAIQAKNADLATKLAGLVTTDQQRVTALIAQNAELDKMVKSYDLIKSKDVVINFTATGLDAIQQSAYGSLGNRVTRTIAPESTAAAPITSTTATVASVAAAASTAATAAASAATQVAQTVASVAETIAASAATDKETKDSLNTIAEVLTATTTNTPASLASVLSPITGVDLGFINLNPARANEDIVVTIVDNTSGLIDVITDATQQASANGINTRLVRNTGGLNW